LLWVLWLGYGWLVIGFALTFLAWVADVSAYLALHAFAVGTLGMITAGMMARVSLGHTGRNVFEPPPAIVWIFVALLVAAAIRVLGPLLWPVLTTFWHGAALLAWMLAFMAFLWIFVPMLLRPRTDGRWG
jgi:uncharacterized protein involved in response to NO